MTTELEEVIINLSKSIEGLKEQYNKVLIDNKKLSSELQSLTEQFKNKEKENESLIGNYESLKMAKSIAVSSGDSHDAKIKINRLVREIDKCVSLLNR
ncbi:MAG: hypothetical protein B6I20_10930 [Bacteroidetes bacterium 4572_117]|nr:MAG: hypothetical protein B6I20_10930 [Bacteroidetes bacterium 4572_117]